MIGSELTDPAAADPPTNTILVMGGSFNPPHLGHLTLLRRCRDYVCAILATTPNPLDIWLVPVGRHPFSKELADGKHRLAMCHLAFAKEDNVSIRDEEILRAAREPGPTYMIDTLREFSRKEPEAKFHLLLGSDQWENRESWRDWSEIELLAPPLWIGRPGASPKEAPHEEEGPDFHFIPGLVEVSSTLIRKKIAAGKPVSDLIVPDVEDYIRQNSLYTK